MAEMNKGSFQYKMYSDFLLSINRISTSHKLTATIFITNVHCLFVIRC